MDRRDSESAVIPEKTEAFSYIAGILGPGWVENAMDRYATFRERWSPDGRWYHRNTRTSPIVPLLFWNSRQRFELLESPMGYWTGHPTEILDRLTRHIRRFEAFWRNLPPDRGIKNLAWALKSRRRFFSLSHELAVAAFIEDYADGKTEPLFLDSRSSAGEPDIVVATSDRTFAIQCKSQDPTKARQLPFDLWQFLAGVVHRMVQDSGRSLHLEMTLKGRLSESEVREIAGSIAGLIRKGVVTPRPWQSPLGEFQLVDLGDGLPSSHLEEVVGSVRSRNHPLYAEAVELPSSTLVGRRVSSIYVTGAGRRGHDVTDVIRKQVTSATKVAQSDRPLVVAVHLYHDIDFRNFPERPLVQQRLIPWSDKFFSANPQLAMIYLSSNFEVYRLRGSDDDLGVKHARSGWVMESPIWDHRDVEALGI